AAANLRSISIRSSRALSPANAGPSPDRNAAAMSNGRMAAPKKTPGPADHEDAANLTTAPIPTGNIYSTSHRNARRFSEHSQKKLRDGGAPRPTGRRRYAPPPTPTPWEPRHAQRRPPHVSARVSRPRRARRLRRGSSRRGPRPEQPAAQVPA